MNTAKSRVIVIIKYFVLFSFIISGISRIALLLLDRFGTVSLEHARTDHLLSLLQCILGVSAVFIPKLLQRRYGFSFTPTIQISYYVFLYCAIFLGEVKNYYITMPLWDDVLHGFSGLMAGIFAFMLVAVATSGKLSDTSSLPPLLIAFFAFTFSVTIGAFWEIYEFTMDGFLELNMQKYRLNDGTMLVGREALFDTMKDVVIDSVGAFTASVWGYLSMKKQSRWLSKYRKTPERCKNNEPSFNGSFTEKKL